MTFRGVRIPAPPSLGPPQIGVVAALVAAGALGWWILAESASKGTVDGLALALGVGAFTVVATRPGIGAVAVPVLIFANAGMVLNENYGVPNVVSGLTVLTLGVMAMSREWRVRLLRTSPVLIAFGAYVGVRVISALQAPAGGNPSQVLQDGLVGVALILVITAVASSQDRLRHAVELVTITAAVLAALTIVKKEVGLGGTWFGFATDNPPNAEQVEASYRAGFRIQGDASRATGPLADANFWAQSLVLAFPLALWSIRRGPTVLGRWLAAVAGAVIAAGVVETQSRGGVIALVLAVSVWLWFQGGGYRLGILVVPLVIVLAVALTGATQRFEALTQLNDASRSSEFRGRLSENIAAFDMWKDHPVLGVGAGEFPANYRRYAADIGLDARSERNAHNSYLEAAAETGTLGAAAFVAMILAALWCGLQARTRLVRAREPVLAGICEALLAGLVGYLAAAVLLHQAFPEYLWAWMAMLAGAFVMALHVRVRDDEEAVA